MVEHHWHRHHLHLCEHSDRGRLDSVRHCFSGFTALMTNRLCPHWLTAPHGCGLYIGKDYPCNFCAREHKRDKGDTLMTEHQILERVTSQVVQLQAKVKDLSTELHNARSALIWSGHTEDCALAQGASMDCSCGLLDIGTGKNARNIELEARVTQLEQDNAQLRAANKRMALSLRTDTIGGYGTHWHECWRTHIDCAAVMIEHLQAQIITLQTK